MLIMWRRRGERFLAGEAEIEILEARYDRVKLGITAPESCIILRHETRVTQQQNISAALSASPAAVQNLLKRFAR